MPRPIADRLVDTDIFSTRFACDLALCKGACCTMPGGSGAPVAEGEIDDLLDAVEHALPYLSEGKRAIINEEGPLEGPVGDRTTRCVEDQDCVFVYYDSITDPSGSTTTDGVAFCAIERAAREGKTPFRKPLSCHLFPIRVDDLFGAERLRYEQIEECRPARTRGEQEEISLVRFLEEPIVRAYGRPFFDALVERMSDR